MSNKEVKAYENTLDMTKWGNAEWKSFFKHKKLGNQQKMFKDTHGGKKAKEKFKETWTKIKAEGLSGSDMVKLVEKPTNLQALGIDPIVAVKIKEGVRIQKEEFHKHTQPKAPSNDDWFTNEFTLELDLGQANKKTITVQPHWTVNDLFVEIKAKIVVRNNFSLLIGGKKYRMNDNKDQLHKKLKDVKGINKINKCITVAETFIGSIERKSNNIFEMTTEQLADWAQT
eukprot:90540_1